MCVFIIINTHYLNIAYGTPNFQTFLEINVSYLIYLRWYIVLVKGAH